MTPEASEPKICGLEISCPVVSFGGKSTLDPRGGPPDRTEEKYEIERGVQFYGNQTYAGKHIIIGETGIHYKSKPVIRYPQKVMEKLLLIAIVLL